MNSSKSATQLDLTEILETARQTDGLSDFGDSDFMIGLRILVDTYNNNGFDEAGQFRNRLRLVSLLAERLRIERALSEHPEIHDEIIKEPIYLTGLPRTGTSALLNLLSCNQQTWTMALWEGLAPSPLPGNPPKTEDHRYLSQVEFLTSVYEKNPEWGAIHHTTADTPEECIHLLNHTFADVQFGVECLMDPYGQWFQANDHTASYRYYADLLRMLQWRRTNADPTATRRRFLLKSPAHLWAIDVLVEIFPDASIIITHRDPVESVGSYASMMESMMTGRTYDRLDLGNRVLEYLAAKMDHAIECRAKLAKSRETGVPIIDISYRDFVADGVATVRKIYDHFGLDLSSDLAAEMETYSQNHQRAEFGEHEYDLADYGLTPDQIRNRFSEYLTKYADVV